MPTACFWQLAAAVARLVKVLGETAATPVGPLTVLQCTGLGFSWAPAVGFDLAA